MFHPKKIKFKKVQKKVTKTLSKASRLAFGSYGLQASENHRLQASHLEAVRRVIIRNIRRQGKIWIRAFPYKPITSKPIKTRMGKGKGSLDHWVCPVKPGQVIFEISCVLPKIQAIKLLKQASQKLPLKTRILTDQTASYILNRHVPSHGKIL